MTHRTFFVAVMLLLATIADEAPAQDTAAARPAAATVDPAVVITQIDELFRQAWARDGVEPAPTTDDAAFLRRLSLDLTGIIPEIGEVRTFLADRRADKRARAIEEFLTRPRHATHLANQWRDVLLPRTVPESTSVAFENWMQTQFLAKTPYDKFVSELLLARGTVGQTPQTLYYAALNSKPSELAASSSRVFLGVQIRCAECHDHPFTAWKQDDFWSYAAFFARVRGPSNMGGPAEVTEAVSGEVRNPATQKSVSPRFLGGAAPETGATAEPRRTQLVRWITQPDNPYFARAAVNRAWSMMFGRGLVHPVDNLDENNPPTHPEVLDLLAKDFASHGYDLRRLFGILAGTRVYQLASSPEGGDRAIKSYAAMSVRSLSSKQIYDGMIRATGRREPLEAAAQQVAQQRSEFLAQIDAPTREATEFQGGIPQTLTMLNGPLMTELTSPWTSDLVAALVDSPFLTDEQRIETLYLATLTRSPTSPQLARSLEWLQQNSRDGDKAQPLADLLWALVNSSEFALNR